MKSLSTWKMIARSMREGKAVMLLYVLESLGSSPGRQGFFMAVNSDGEMEGSIGGGMMEHKFVEMAKDQLSQHPEIESSSSIRKQVHDKSAAKNQSGMICSGEQTILLYRLKKEENQAITDIIASLEKNKNGTINLSPEGVEFDDTASDEIATYYFKSEDDWRYKQRTGFSNRLFIIGGGHCSLAFSKLMRS
ncbi:MAG: XdhC family protein, partial [Chitinophagaceae bacterium]|nr:XdhC family protein [Chitinophagaceae bacterium]